MNYYNEFDPYAAAWLHYLIAADLIPAGHVDTRSITEVEPDDLRGYTQCHFFAGIGGWSRALTIAGWSNDVPVWTGSCPCQPFSCSGLGLGVNDPRHLWPRFRWLIEKRKPPVVFGEQVASKDGRLWLNRVRIDLEAMGYAVGAADLCAAGISAPHIRQRLYWLSVSDSGSIGLQAPVQYRRDCASPDCGGEAIRIRRRCDPGELVNGLGAGLERHRGAINEGDQPGRFGTHPNGSVAPAGFWDQFRIVGCRDGKARRIPLPESGVFPLAYGIPRGMGKGRPERERLAIRAASAYRVGSLKGYGNAIVPQLAAEFILAAMAC